MSWAAVVEPLRPMSLRPAGSGARKMRAFTHRPFDRRQVVSGLAAPPPPNQLNINNDLASPVSPQTRLFRGSNWCDRQSWRAFAGRKPFEPGPSSLSSKDLSVMSVTLSSLAETDAIQPLLNGSAPFDRLPSIEEWAGAAEAGGHSNRTRPRLKTRLLARPARGFSWLGTDRCRRLDKRHLGSGWWRYGAEPSCRRSHAHPAPSCHAQGS